MRIFNQMVMLTKDRDKYMTHYLSTIIYDPLQNNEQQAQTPTTSRRKSLTVNAGESNHHAIELADWKAKVRKQRQELEEKSEMIMEYKEDLEQTQSQLGKLKLESQEWFEEACRASAYRDEVDVLRERSERADRLETEVQRLRDKISDVEFYKNRVEELREDNKNLMETHEMLEEQLSRARKRSDYAMTLETEIIKYKQKINDLVLERDADQK